ncbi:MAG: hypothetical protein VKK43_05120 [Synechococcaceae cyanobacterium]|nr:hypothetical protein [Synechococcaceae cyanobacterium]
MAANAAPRAGRPWLLLAAGLALLPGAALVPLRAAPTEPPYPTTANLRALQLVTLNCGRDNSEAPCAQARRDADGLLDHPRLPGRCKDVLWSIRQKAVVAATNSFARREPIDAAGREVLAACRALPRAAAKPAESKPAAGGGGFGFGGGSGGSGSGSTP